MSAKARSVLLKWRLPASNRTNVTIHEHPTTVKSNEPPNRHALNPSITPVMGFRASKA